MVGPVICDICSSIPITNDSKFYHVRITDSGKDDGVGSQDYKICASCLLARVDSGVKLGMVESIRRIENPKPEVSL